MSKATFRTFRDASIFAKQCAQESSATVKIERLDDCWVVTYYKMLRGPDEEAAQANLSDNAVYVSEIKELRREREELRREVSKVKGKLKLEREQREKERLAKLRPYLEEREKYYASLPYDELYELWKCRELNELIYEEAQILKAALRKIILRKEPGVSEPNELADRQECSRCHGTGFDGDCDVCEGKGWSTHEQRQKWQQG